MKSNCTYRNPGKVVFIGEVHYAKGVFVGVIPSDRTLGKNNGMYHSIHSQIRSNRYIPSTGVIRGVGMLMLN